MRLTLKYFASLREALGPGAAVDWTPEPGVAPTAAALRAWLRGQSQAHAQALAPTRAVRVAVDQALVDDAAPLRDGAEVAFFPPVTGG
jgi:molybdopterin synthase sulfur carrier subunit